VALYWAAVPTESEAGGDGVEVLAQAVGEAGQRDGCGGLCGVDPVGQVLTIELGHQLGEGVGSGDGEFWAVVEDVLESECFVAAEADG
jgi:hypothetical protein